MQALYKEDFSKFAHSEHTMYNSLIDESATRYHFCLDISAQITFFPNLQRAAAGRYRPVSYPDRPRTARCIFRKNAYWEAIKVEASSKFC